MKGIGTVCKLSGVSRRTLQYYDEIGLLPPSAVTKSGYRQYNNENLCRLWSILFYKELGFSLDKIRMLLDGPKEIEKELMRQHKQVLLEKQSQLKKMSSSVGRILDGKFEISMLRDFDKNKLEAARKTYANNIQVLMESRFFLPLVKTGIPSNNTPLIENASRIMSKDLGDLISLCEKIIYKFHKAIKDGPKSLAAKEAVAAYGELINMWIPHNRKIFHKIGQAYLEYEEDLDEKTPGLAKFVYEAILHVYK